MIAARLVNVSGVSDVFMQGMVTYSNEAKVRLLGVKEETLKAHGAVSRETALEMALAEQSGPRPMFVWLLPVLQVLEAVARKNR